MYLFSGGLRGGNLLENGIQDRIYAWIQGPEQTQVTEPPKTALTTQVSTKDNVP